MESLSQKIDMIRGSAASFYAVDLHLHSPCSYDWDNSRANDDERNPNLDKIPTEHEISDEALENYCSAISSSGRHLTAITDHNRSCFSEAASCRHKGQRPCVLPGIELSVTFSQAPLIWDLRIHILAVFPEETHNEAIARILPAGTEPERKRNPRSEFTYKSVEELIDLTQLSGFMIAI